MALSNYLAEVWGISIVVVSLSPSYKRWTFKKLFASLETEESFFLWGFISLVIGIAMVLAYNVWARTGKLSSRFWAGWP